MAKEAASRHQKEVEISRSLNDIYSDINETILKEWQEIYTENKTGSFYKSIHPVVSLKIKYQDKNRQKEQFLTKLRLGLTLLNDRKFKLGLHDNNLCENCQSKPETIEHVLFDCQSFPIFRKNHTIKETLTDLNSLNIIYEYFSLNNRISNI